MSSGVCQAARVTCVLCLALASKAFAEPYPDAASVEALRQQIALQQARLDAQQAALDKQRDQLAELEATVAQLLPAGTDSERSGAGSTTVVPVYHEDDDDEDNRGLEVEGYGIVNYLNRDWETDPFAKNTLDTERFILELEYRFDQHFFANAEIEFEHGGTGVALDLDTQEEFGEYEQEIEKGGEVVVEEMYLGYRYSDWLNARFGHFYVPVGRTNLHHEPDDYFTVQRSQSEAAVIPQVWHESGVSVYGSLPLFDLGRIKYEMQIVSGLDSTGFSSRNWIAGGFQQRFEEARAEDLAFVGRLDYYPLENLQLGGSYYGGNTVGNRPKNDVDFDAWVDILEFDFEWKPGDLTLRGQYLWGRLQNSHLITDANRNLSNNLGVKRTPVGSEAQSWYVEGGYDLLRRDDRSLILFGRYESYDSMYRTEGLVFDNPRWDRESWTVGIDYLPIPGVIFKADYTHRTLGIAENNEEDTFGLGVGFTY